MLISSCFSLADFQKEREDLPCDEETLMSDYFTDYDKCLRCSSMIVSSGKDKGLNQLLNFIKGENYFLKGDDRNGFERLISSASGPDCNISVASIEYIRNMALNYGEIDSLSTLNTSMIKEPACRSLIDLEKKQWQIIKGKFKSAAKIDNYLNFLKEVKVIKTNFSDTEAKTVSVTLPYAQDTLYFSDFFNSLENSEIKLQYSFSINEDKTVPLIIKTDSPYKLFVNNVLIDASDNSNYFNLTGEFKLTKGDFNITVDLVPATSNDSFFAVFMPCYDDWSPFFSKEATGKQGNIQFVDQPSNENESNFSKYLSLLSSSYFGKPSNEDSVLDLYSSVLGVKTPGVLFVSAQIAYKNGNIARAESIFKYLISERPDLHRVLLNLMKIMLDSNRFDELDELISKVDFNFKNSFYYDYFLSNYYGFRELYSESLRIAENNYRKHKNYPAAIMNYAAALEDFGSTRYSNEIRMDVLRNLLYYLPVIENALELAEITGDLELQIILLKKILEINVYNTKAGIKLGNAYIRNLEIKKGEEVLRKVLEIKPDSVEALISMGDLYTLMNEKEKADKYYKAAYESAPDRKETISRMAVIFDTDFRDFFKDYSETDDEVYKRVVNTQPLMIDKPYEVIFDEGLQKIVNRKMVKGYFRMAVKLNNIEGVRLFSEIDKDGAVINARIIKKDGSISRNIKEEFNKLVFYKLEPGDTIDYTYLVTQENNTWLDAFNSVWHFGQFGVINRYSKLSVFVPLGMPVNFYTLGNIEETVAEINSGHRLYVFKGEDIFLPKKEILMPDDILSVIPNVQMSAVASWDDFARWQTRFLKESSVMTDKILSFIEEILLAGGEKKGIVAVLRDYVARDISYSFTDSGIYLVKPERTDIVFNRKSGDCKDKALLLKVLLDAAGIKSQYALVKSRISGEFKKELPYMQFDHAIVYIPAQDGIDKPFFVDPTSSYDHYLAINPEIEGSTAMILDELNCGYTFEVVKSDIVDSISIKTVGDNKFELLLTGGAASTYRFRNHSGESDNDIISDTLINKLGVNVFPFDISVSGSIFQEPLLIQFSSKPFVPMAATKYYAPLMAVSKRNYPLHLHSKTKHYSFLIKADTIKDPSKINKTVDNNFFNYSVVVSDQNTVLIKFHVKKNRIKSEEFAQLKKSIINIVDFEKQLLSEIAW
jgi:tetratricopeptide (TPR) repeat protein